MSENPYAILGLVPGPIGDRRVTAAYERRLRECRRRIRDENRRAAREESLIYAYAVLRDSARREQLLKTLQPEHTEHTEHVVLGKDVPVVRVQEAVEERPDAPHGGNKPDAIRSLCGCIDNAIVDGEIDPSPISGRQEQLENLVNQTLWKTV